MKKLLLVLFFIINLSPLKAQVVFCPPGAEWHFLFAGSMFWPGTTYNETIKCIGDSISGTETIKILSHYKFYMTCGVSVQRTLLKQIGDTIFIRNGRTQNTWQILYNFATPVGQTWQTTILGQTNPMTLIFTVQATNTIVENGFSLKTMTVALPNSGGTIITERFGSNRFLFPFSHPNPGLCDGGNVLEFLCYQDSTFGIKQFGDKSCDYFTLNGVGFEEENNQNSISVYPNPANDYLNIKTNSFSEFVELIVLNSQGSEVKRIQKVENDEKVDVSDLNKGIYLLTILKENEVVYRTKIIKE